MPSSMRSSLKCDQAEGDIRVVLGFPIPELGDSLICELAALIYFLGVFFGGDDAYAAAQSTQSLREASPVCFGITTDPPQTSNRGRWSGVFGDPHLSTFDRLRFDCQAEGEFTMVTSLETPDFKIQERFTSVGSNVCSQASVSTGMVMADVGFPTIQLSISTSDTSTSNESGGCPINLFVDGTRQNLVEGSASADFEILIDMPTQITVFLPFSYRSSETIIGLLGRPIGIRGDDWVSPKGTAFAPSANQAESFFSSAYNYCVTNWCIREAEASMFTYQDGEDFGTFFGCNEDYSADLELAVENAEEDLSAICGSDLSCLVDGICGDLQDAQAALGDAAGVEADQQDGNPLLQDAFGNFLGNFSGVVTRNNGAVYPVEIQYTEGGIRTTYASLRCGNANLFPVLATGSGRIEWIQRIDFGSCINGGIESLIQKEGEEFGWDFFWRKDSITVVGGLTLEPSALLK